MFDLNKNSNFFEKNGTLNKMSSALSNINALKSDNGSARFGALSRLLGEVMSFFA